MNHQSQITGVIPMSEKTRIVDLSSRVMEGDPWHAANIATLLADVTAAEAAARPIPGAHSIWQLVLHMTGWAEEVRSRMSGGPAGNPAAGDWPRVGPVGRARWEAARAALFGAYRALHRDVSRMATSDLSRPTVDPRNRATGEGMSRYVTLHGVIHHAAYHAGQIAILKRALRG
jgi:uncharacterized damage-inducible protein DinB